MVQNAAHHILHQILTLAFNGHIDVEAAAGLVGDGLGGKVRVQAVAGGNGLDHRAEGHRVVRRGQGIGIAEIDLVLAGTLLMVGGFRLNSHALQRQADLPADVLALVVRGDIHIGCPVVGNVRRFAVFIQLKEVKFQL